MNEFQPKIPKRAFKGVWIPRELWETTDLTWSEKCLLAEIDSLDENNKGCYAANDFLAVRFGTTVGTLKVILSKLRRLGFLVEKSCSVNASTERRLSVCFAPKKKHLPLTGTNGVPLDGVNRAVNQDLRQPLTGTNGTTPHHIVPEIPVQIPLRVQGAEAPLLGDENQEASTKKRTAPKAPKEDPSVVIIPREFDTPEFRKAWLDFIHFRKHIRKPLTIRAAELTLTDLQGFTVGKPDVAGTAVAIVNKSIANGWQGIFELKTNNQSYANNRSARQGFNRGSCNDPADYR